MLLKEKKPIIEWLNKYQVESYTLRPDETYGYIVDVAGDVFLNDKNLKKIAVKFGKVTGNFYGSSNNLTCLEGSPQEIVGRDFWCQDNQLISLQGMPESVGGRFNCYDNPALGELQDIKDFKVIKSYLLAERLAHELDMKDNQKKIKL